MTSLAKRPFTRRHKSLDEYISMLELDNIYAVKENTSVGGTATLSQLAKNSVADDHDSSDWQDAPNKRASGHDWHDMGVHRAEVQTPKSPSSDSLTPQYQFAYEFGWIDMLIGIGSILVFLADFGTDIHLVIQYFLEGEITYGAVSLVLTAGPSLVTSSLGLHWYILDYRREQFVFNKVFKTPEQRQKFHKYRISSQQWIFRFVMTVLQLGPIVRIGEYLYYGYKSKTTSGRTQKRYHEKMLCEDVDACLLRLFESFLESAPQLTWQLYVWIILRPEEDVVRLSTRIFTLLTSWMALAISLVSYHRSLRFSRKEKEVMKKRAIPFYLIWRASEIGNRVLCMSLFASSFHYIVFIPVGIHWICISAWLMCQKTRFYKNVCLEKIFNIICGYVMIFCYLNLKEGHTRLRYLLFYSVFYVENLAMLVTWFISPQKLGEWFLMGGLCSVLSLMCLHIVFQLLYYMLCHPTGSIEVCLPCDSRTCYELICHDLDENKEKGKAPKIPSHGCSIEEQAQCFPVEEPNSQPQNTNAKKL